MSVKINGSGSITGVNTVQTIPAADVEFVPTGNIIATNVQTALAELDVEKAQLSALSSSNGSVLIGYKLASSDAVSTTLQKKLGESVSVFDFMTEEEITAVVTNTWTTVSHVTQAIQKAINYVSNTIYKTLFFPAGTYKFTRLYCVYDAINNPGYNINRNSEIILQGDAILPETGPTTGTVLNCTSSTGDALIVSSSADDASPWRSREFELRDITVKANTTGYAIKAAGVIIPRFNNTNIINDNLNGSGLYISTSFFATIEKTSIKNNGVGTKTGDAIRFDTMLFAGLFTLRDVNINGFANGLYKGTGGWQNISIYDSEIAANEYPIYIASGTLDLLNIQGCYFEGVCTSFIKVFPDNGLGNLNISGSWFYSQHLNGPAISLTKPYSVSIAGSYSLDQYTTFLNISGIQTGYNGGANTVNGLTFNYTANPTSPVYYFSGIIPALYGVEYPTAVANCNLTAGLNRQITARANYANSSYLAAGHMLETATYKTGSIAGVTIDLTTQGYPAFITTYNVTSPATFQLPAISSGLPHGYTITITNNKDSTQTPIVKTAPEDGGITIANIAPGSQRRFVFFSDGTNIGWE